MNESVNRIYFTTLLADSVPRMCVTLNGPFLTVPDQCVTHLTLTTATTTTEKYYEIYPPYASLKSQKHYTPNAVEVYFNFS